MPNPVWARRSGARFPSTRRRQSATRPISTAGASSCSVKDSGTLVEFLQAQGGEVATSSDAALQSTNGDPLAAIVVKSAGATVLKVVEQAAEWAEPLVVISRDVSFQFRYLAHRAGATHVLAEGYPLEEVAHAIARFGADAESARPGAAEPAPERFSFAKVSPRSW